MGIIGKFRLATGKQVAALVQDPSQVEDFLMNGPFDEEKDEYVGDDPALTLDIDKAWHGLHFLFTGSAQGGHPPLNFIQTGGTALGDRDVFHGVGHGPARAYTPEQLKEIAGALQGLSSGELRRRFDPAEMRAQGIYPDIWSYSEEETIGYLLENFEQLASFCRRGAAADQGLIVYKD